MRKNRKKYDKVFKLEAIRLVVEEGRKVSEVERNLDISSGTLARWGREKKTAPEEAFSGKGYLKAKDEEIRKLRAELKNTKEERDII